MLETTTLGVRCQEIEFTGDDVEEFSVVPYIGEVLLNDVLTFPGGRGNVKINITAKTMKVLTSIALKVENVKMVEVTVTRGNRENVYEKKPQNGVS